MRSFRFAACLAFLALTAWSAQSTRDLGKKIWELSDEERVAARVAPATGGTVRAQGVGAPSSPERAGGHREFIDGRRDPQLFLPFELFDVLVGGLSDNSMTRGNARRTLDPGIKKMGYDVDRFWTTLGGATAAYLKLTAHTPEKRRTRFLHFTSPSGDSVTVLEDPARCSARIDALNRARRAFSDMPFDRLLYTVVAPELKHSSVSTERNHGEQLRFLARGCK